MVAGRETRERGKKEKCLRQQQEQRKSTKRIMEPLNVMVPEAISSYRELTELQDWVGIKKTKGYPKYRSAKGKGGQSAKAAE